jgi:hypothetical protein
MLNTYSPWCSPIRAAITIFVFSVLSLAGCLAHENSGKIEVVRAFEIGAVSPVLCYAKSPAFIVDQEDGKGGHDIVWMSFDGMRRLVLHLDGMVASRSLSCSGDGAVIAVLRENPSSNNADFFIIKSDAVSQYRLNAWPINPVRGRWSLLSEDGNSISLPAEPHLLSGPDVVGNMHLFVNSDGNTFFSEGALVHDREATIEVLIEVDGKWQNRTVIAKPSSSDMSDAGRCFNRTLSLMGENDTETNELYDITSGSLQRPVGIGFDRVRSLGSISNGSSEFGHCIYAITAAVNAAHSALRGIAVVGSAGLMLYRGPKRPGGQADNVTPSTDRISITKDGCYALVTAFVKEPKIPQFTLPQHVLLLKLEGSGKSCL